MKKTRSPFIVFSVLFYDKNLICKAYVRRITESMAHEIYTKIFLEGGYPIKYRIEKDTPSSPGYGLESKRQLLQREAEASMISDLIPNIQKQASMQTYTPGLLLSHKLQVLTKLNSQQKGGSYGFAKAHGCPM